MTIIGQRLTDKNRIVFYCLSKNGWYSSMIVMNIFGALDVANSLPTMSEETFKEIAGDMLA